jgi:membrane protein DedA with SNARE-associated domain
MPAPDGEQAVGATGGALDRFFQWMLDLPDALVYVVVGVLAALENVVPPVPADVVALFGGFLSGIGTPNPWIVFSVVWLANAAGAMLVYWFGRHHGTRFFSGPLGRRLLQPTQLARLAAFHAMHGPKVIFVSRFLPGFRAVVPIFAGTTGVSVVRTAVPIAVASAIWYGAIVYVGATAGRNWDEIRHTMDAPGRLLGVVALAIAVLLAWLWWRSREKAPEDGTGRV